MVFSRCTGVNNLETLEKDQILYGTDEKVVVIMGELEKVVTFLSG